MIKNFLQTAWRRLWQYRSASFLSIAGLSIGMTSALLIFLWVQNEMSYDSYNPQADRTYRITAYLTNVKWVWATVPLPTAAAVQQKMPEIEKTTNIRGTGNIAFHIGNEYFPEKKCAYIDSNWFDFFHYDFLEGNPKNFFNDPFSILLTESTAKKYFGSREAIGQAIQIDTINYRVAAVVKDNPANSSFQFDVLISLQSYLSNPAAFKNDATYNNYNYRTFLRLRPGANPKKVAAGIAGVFPQSGNATKTTFDLISLKDMHFETGLTNQNDIQPASIKSVYIFSVLGVFLLVIACINYVNLTTARASRRAKEVSIRKVIGAGKASLFSQFILESLLVSLISLIITIILVRLSLPLFRQLTEKNFTDPLLHLFTWKLIGLTLLAATLLNGIYPALMLASFKPLSVFKGLNVLKVKDAWLRKGLVVLQFTFSVLLIISTIIIQRQMNYIQSLDPGYSRSQLFSFTLPWSISKGKSETERESMFSDVRHELLKYTSVAGATAASQSIVNLQSSNAGSADWDGHDTSFRPTVFQLSADPYYKDVLQIQLAQGRWFQPDSKLDQHNFVLNETAIKDFKIHTPVLGQRFTFQGDTGQIIGVVKDFHFASLHKRIGDMVFMNNPGWRNTIFVKTQAGKTPQALAAAKALWQRLAPDKPFEYIFQDEQFDQLYKDDRRLSTMIWVFSVIAIFISCLGLFGLAAFAAEQRTKEIGIRKVLGATVGNLVTLLSTDFLRLVLLSILIASPVAGWLMHQWLQDFAYHVPLSAWIFLLAGSMALLIAILTISFQALKAARSNPVKNLRTE
ncbi:MAG: ABC transporter permease [Bacteroidetes bacterium]|nr:ABC transporter permease [Bacteroidota bacterium]